jgi:hypothetical protein
MLLLLLLLLQVSTDGCNPYHCWQNDYHAARKDRVTELETAQGPSHKPGLIGKLIEDSEATNVTEHYGNFCGYYNVDLDEMTVDAETFGSWGSLEDRVKSYRNTVKTASVWAEPLPYNATTDAALDASSEDLVQEDRLWESKRGSKEWEDWHNKWGATNGLGSRPPSRWGRKLLL